MENLRPHTPVQPIPALFMTVSIYLFSFVRYDGVDDHCDHGGVIGNVEREKLDL